MARLVVREECGDGAYRTGRGDLFTKATWVRKKTPLLLLSFLVVLLKRRCSTVLFNVICSSFCLALFEVVNMVLIVLLLNTLPCVIYNL